MLTAPPVRLLSASDLPAVRAVLDADPIAHAAVTARIRQGGLAPHRLGAEVYGWPTRGPLRSLLWSGANLVPVGVPDPAVDPAVVRAFAAVVAATPRSCSSVVGPAPAVLGLWDVLAPTWGPAREVRPRQPLLAADRPPAAVESAPDLRRGRTSDLNVLLPACVAMYTEEVGVSPLTADGGTAYIARVSELVRTGLSYVLIRDGRVAFKAEIGAVTPATAQLQGVWVAPPWRGRGLGTAGVAAVVTRVLADVAPTVSLYVNDFNVAARAVYARCGFRRVGEFATVLL